MKHVNLQSTCTYVSEVAVVCIMQFMYGMTHIYVLTPSEFIYRVCVCECVWKDWLIDLLIDWLDDWLTDG